MSNIKIPTAEKKENEKNEQKKLLVVCDNLDWTSSKGCAQK